MKGLAQSHAEFYFPEFKPRARGLESRSSSPRAAQALAAGLGAAVSGPVALSARFRDPAPCPGRLETARLAPRQHLRPRPPQPAPGGPHLFSRIGEPSSPRGEATVRSGQRATSGREPRTGRRVCSGALEPSLASEDRSPRLHRPGG